MNTRFAVSGKGVSFLAGTLILMASASQAQAAILNVPTAQYPTIQAGINAAVNGDVEWFGGSRAVYRVGLIQRDGCHGGIVLVRFAPGGQAPYTSAYYFEAWFNELQGQATYSDDRDLHALRELGYAVRKAISESHKLIAA